MVEKTWNTISVLFFLLAVALMTAVGLALATGEIFAFVWASCFALAFLCAGFLARAPRPMAGSYLRPAQRQPRRAEPPVSERPLMPPPKPTTTDAIEPGRHP